MLIKNHFFTDIYPTLVTLKIYHGGFFTKKPGREYVSGKMEYVDLVDTNEFSVHELEAMVETLGYQTSIPTFYHFNVPGLSLDCGLQALGNDDDVRSFFKHVGSSKVFSIYVEHWKPTVDTYLRSPGASSKVIIEELPMDQSPEYNRSKKKVVKG